MQKRCRKNKTRPRSLAHPPAACTIKSAAGTNSYAPMCYFPLGTFLRARPSFDTHREFRTGNPGKRIREASAMSTNADRESRSPFFYVSILPGKLRRKTGNTSLPSAHLERGSRISFIKEVTGRAM